MDAFRDALVEQYQKRLRAFNAKPVNIREKQPPRMSHRTLPQQFLCPCWSMAGKDCPECGGKSPKMQDPNGRPGNSIPSCPVCRCQCCCGPFKEKERGALAAAFEDFRRKKEGRATVSEHRDIGLGNLSTFTEVCIQVCLLVSVCCFATCTALPIHSFLICRVASADRGRWAAT